MLLNQEVKFLLLLKHPHIVNLLATFGNRSSPILLMERMWMSFTKFLTEQPDMKHKKIDVLYETACGLQYIHEKGIIHCDLTTDNILLTENTTAKLANFGRATFNQQNMNFMPENLDHLPPEVIFTPYSKASYSTKVDVFSFGCVIVHTFIQECFLPDFHKYLEISEVGRHRKLSETEKRSVGLNKFKENCNSIKLHYIMLKCLQDNPEHRPTAATLCSLLEKKLPTDAFKSFKCGMFCRCCMLSIYNIRM